MPFWSGFVLAVVTAFPCAVAFSGAQDPAPIHPSHVRSENSRIAAMLLRGERESPTVHRLLSELAASDVILIVDTVETAQCDCSRAVSCLSLVTADARTRYLRAKVSLRQIDDRLIAQIAHELQHAAEIAAVLEIRDEPALARFYAARSEGCDGSSCFETDAAIDVQRAVTRELVQATRPK